MNVLVPALIIVAFVAFIGLMLRLLTPGGVGLREWFTARIWFQ